MSAAQTWNSQSYEKHARFVSDLGMPVVELLKPQPGERILDLGCGDGVLTRRIADLGCDVVGVEPSPEFAAAARERGLTVVEQSAYEMTFVDEFEAVFSNAALHWMKAADEVIGRVFRALRPGGRFTAEFGGHGCVRTLRSALIEELNAKGYDGAGADPWYFPTAEDYSDRLRRAGFSVESCALIPRPTRLPGDVLGWLETFAKSFLSVLPEEERGAFLIRIRSRVQDRLCDSDGNWTADYVRLRFSAVKPARSSRQPPASSR